MKMKHDLLYHAVCCLLEAKKSAKQGSTTKAPGVVLGHKPLTRAQQDLVVNNIGLAISIADKFRSGPAEFDEICAQARLALVRAAQYYHPEKHKKFSSFAYTVIANELKRYFRSSMSYAANELRSLDAPAFGDEDETTNKDHVVSDYDLDPRSSYDLNPSQWAQRGMSIDILNAALARIKDPNIAGALLGFRAGKSFREIGRGLKCSPTMACHYFNYGIKAIQKEIEGKGVTIDDVMKIESTSPLWLARLILESKFYTQGVEFGREDVVRHNPVDRGLEVELKDGKKLVLEEPIDSIFLDWYKGTAKTRDLLSVYARDDKLGEALTRATHTTNRTE